MGGLWPQARTKAHLSKINIGLKSTIHPFVQLFHIMLKLNLLHPVLICYLYNLNSASLLKEEHSDNRFVSSADNIRCWCRCVSFEMCCLLWQTSIELCLLMTGPCNQAHVNHRVINITLYIVTNVYFELWHHNNQTMRTCSHPLQTVTLTSAAVSSVKLLHICCFDRVSVHHTQNHFLVIPSICMSSFTNPSDRQILRT